ncbi:MAG: DUF3520 domain-containing protein, partial [Bacteroidota bacterium]|nr:DUF3520 domain-containing protein [Bacteroidota bacterium]
VKQYRLIGYDNKRNVLAEKDDELEGGEIGPGSGNTAIFEIIPLDTGNVKPFKPYFANVTLHYKLPGDTAGNYITHICPQNYLAFNSIPKSLQFASAVTMLGLKLRESPYFPPTIDWDFIKNIATSALDPADFLENEFIGLVDKASDIYNDKKRKRRKKE